MLYMSNMYAVYVMTFTYMQAAQVTCMYASSITKAKKCVSINVLQHVADMHVSCTYEEY